MKRDLLCVERGKRGFYIGIAVTSAPCLGLVN
jgi:hypothetical protein